MKKILLLVSVFLLSSCMKLDSAINIDANGVAKSVATIDMAKFISVIEAMGTGSDSAGINKDLCKDENFSGWLYESLSESKDTLADVKCTSVGDYKAKVEGTQDFSKKKWILLLSWVTIIDMLALWDENRVPKSGWDELSPSSAEDMGFSIHQSYTLPGVVVYKEAGTLSGSSTVELNLLDPKVLKKRSLILISSTSGKTLTTREINAYKLLLKRHNRKVK